MSERTLESMVACVTGGGRGIGRAICHSLAEAGATVYTCARTESQLRETVDSNPGPGEIVAHVADVRDTVEMDQMFDDIDDVHDGLDVLVANAGVLGPRKPIEEVSPEAWSRTQRINIDGVFLANRMSIPLMRKRLEHDPDAAPVILNISSSVGREGRARWGPYATSKFAVEGLTETLADELADDGFTVISANPGGTATPMRAAAYPDEDPETLPEPESVASVLRMIIAEATPAQTGAKYDCQDLFSFVDRIDEESVDPGKWPTVED